MIEEESNNDREELIKELSTKIMLIESLLMDLEKISGRLYDCPINEEDKQLFSKLKTNIYHKRDELGFKKEDVYKEINREKRRERKKRKKEFLKEVLEDK
jgi:hypothetical protein